MSRKKTRLQSVSEAPQIRRDACGIDISPEVIYVAVGPQQDAQAVRAFGTFTAELYRIANWLRACGVRTIAMESTGVYWIPLFQVLEDRGVEVPGRKGCVRRGVAAVPANGRAVASIVPATANGMLVSDPIATSGGTRASG